MFGPVRPGARPTHSRSVAGLWPKREPSSRQYFTLHSSVRDLPTAASRTRPFRSHLAQSTRQRLLGSQPGRGQWARAGQFSVDRAEAANDDDRARSMMQDADVAEGLLRLLGVGNKDLACLRVSLTQRARGLPTSRAGFCGRAACGRQFWLRALAQAPQPVVGTMQPRRALCAILACGGYF